MAAAATTRSATSAGTLTVTPAALTVTADNETKTYGAANPALTVSYSGFVNGDTAAEPDDAADADDDGDAGEPGRARYPITASGARSGAQLHDQLRGRHADGHPGGADGHGRRRRRKTYGAANPTLTASYSGFVNGDTAAEPDDAADG